MVKHWLESLNKSNKKMKSFSNTKKKTYNYYYNLQSENHMFICLWHKLQHISIYIIVVVDYVCI